MQVKTSKCLFVHRLFENFIVDGEIRKCYSKKTPKLDMIVRRFYLLASTSQYHDMASLSLKSC